MKQISLAKIQAYFISAAFAASFIFLLGQPFNYSTFLPSSYRVVNIPIYFWVSYLTYLIVTHRIFIVKAQPLSAYIKRGVLLGIFVNLYILLGNLIISLIDNRGQLSDLYLLYIELVFLVFTSTMVFMVAKELFPMKESGPTKVLLYFPLAVYPMCLLLQNLLLRYGSFAMLIGVFMIMGLSLTSIKMEALRRTGRKLFSKDINVIAVIFLLALIVRLIFGIILVDKTTHGPNGYDGYLRASDDGLTYDATANKILKDPAILNKGGVVLWGHWDEMYSIFLSVLYKVFGRNFYVLVSIQAILGAFIPVLIFAIGSMLFSRTVGVIAATLLSLKGGLIMLSSYMGHEAVWLPILYLAMFILTRYFKTNGSISIIWDIGMGFALGALIVFRSLYFYFVPFIIMWEMLFFRKIKFIRKMAHILIVTALCACVLFGVMRVFNNKISVFNKNKAELLWYTSRPVPPFQYLGNERFDPLGINFIKDPKGAFIIAAKNPLEFITLALKLYPLRVVAYLETYQFGFFDPVYMINPANMKNEFAPTLEFYFTLFFVVGMTGCVLRRGILSSPVFLLLVFHILFFAILLFQPSPRVKEISSPMVYLIGSFGAGMIFKYLTKRY